MATYNDLEIQCLVDAIHRHEARWSTQLQEKHEDIRRILRETAHVLELLMEPSAAMSLTHIADGFEYVDATELSSFREDMHDLLRELDVTSIKEALECTWLQVPDHLSAREAREALDDLES